MIDVVILGAGGHGQVIADAIEEAGEMNLLGFLDDNLEIQNQTIAGYRVLGLMKDLSRYVKNVGVVLGIGDNVARQRLFDSLSPDIDTPNIIHPSAVISKRARLGRGVFVGAKAVINTGAVIGDNVIINTSASVDHHCIIGSHSHIAPGSHLAGGSEIGTTTLIGVGSCLCPKIRVGHNCLIGAGSVLNRNIEDHFKAFGNPCKVKSKI